MFKHTYFKKNSIIAVLLCLVIFCSWFAGLQFNSEAAGIPIVSGATYFEDKFTGDGKASVYYATVDLNDASVMPVLLTKKTTTQRGTISSMMNHSDDIIGINGSFYTTAGGVSNAVGIIVEDGVIRSMSPSLNDPEKKYATLCFEENGTATIKYFKPCIIAKSSNGTEYKINRYNYAYEGGTGISLYDENFGNKSYGNTYDDVYEIVVRKGIMKSLRKNEDPVEIPKKGFILTASGSGAKKLKKMFVKGGFVSLESYTNSDNYIKPTPIPEPSNNPELGETTAPDATPAITPHTTPNASAVPSSQPTAQATAHPTPTPTPTATVSTYVLLSNITTTPEPTVTPGSTITPSVTVTAAPTFIIPTTTEPTIAPSIEPSTSPMPSFDPVAFEGLSFGKYKICITGGAQLVSSGNALSSFSHLPVGTGPNSRTPKTAVGISEDGKSLFLVTIDGRSSKDDGISMRNIAKYMKDLGAYNAINFDGGGSTTFVAKLPGESSPTVKNNPSDGKQRNVINGLGIRCALKSDGVPTNGQISGQDTALVSVPVKLNMNIWDASLNACEYNKADVTWEISGVEGTISSNGLFTATSRGTAFITAKYKHFTFTKEVRVYSKPTSWELSYSPKLFADKGTTYDITLNAKNKNGKTCSVYNKLIDWSLTGSIGSITNTGNLAISKAGVGTVTAIYDDMTYSLPVSVCHNREKIFQPFSTKKKITYKKKHMKITQAVNTKKKFKKDADKSLKLTYKIKKKQKKPLKISIPVSRTFDANTYKIGTRFYVPKIKNITNTVITLHYVNKKGKQKKITLTKTIKKGWNKILCPSALDNKCKLKKYEITVKYRKKHSATIYLDSLITKHKYYP